MNEVCVVCNSEGPLTRKDIFSETNTLANSHKLLETLQEIIGKTLDENTTHSRILCRKCHKGCVDYDASKTKMKVIRHEMGHQYTATVQKWPTLKISSPLMVKEEKTMGTIVVPASKLLPVPADFQLNFSQLSGFGQVAVSRGNMVSQARPSPMVNLKVTIGSSVFTQSLKTSTVKIGKPLDTIDTAGIVTSSKADDMNEWNVNLLPKDIFSTTNEDQNYEGDENGDNEGDETGKGDENEMEIDEDCTLGATPVSSQSEEFAYDIGSIKTEANQLSDNTQYINVNVLPGAGEGDAGGNYVKLKIYKEGNEEDDVEHTILVDGENASLLEMMTGQKLVYENGELSLVMQDDDDEGIENEGEENVEEGDGQDSNDESQIELQVSGDEDTANAIIAAAREQGGAFIKVESGEMYRVRSVQSAPADGLQLGAFVRRLPGGFGCVRCQRAAPGEQAMREPLAAAPMMRHLKAAHDVKLYLCQLCGAGMRRRQDYTAHAAEHSAKLAAEKGTLPIKTKLHECDVCKKCYNSRTLLQEHMNTHTGTRPYQCPQCKKTFASKYTHQAHLKTHEERPRPFKCKQCNKTFLSQQNLNQHEKTHSGVKNFVCNVCDKAFGTQHNLEVHGVVHTGARPYKCSRCRKGFARRAELADHLRIHTGERPFECEVCGARFAQRSNLHSHRRATHLDDKRHACPDCPKRFKRRRLLEYHVKATHTGERPLKCEVCHSSFVYPEHYRKHIRIHSGERPYFCEICGKSFNSRDNRNTHRFTHSDKKPYECLACGHSYMRKRLLIAHMNASGHLAESIVVNQPRVTRVHNSENGVTTIVQLNDQPEVTLNDGDNGSETIFRPSGKLELLDEKEEDPLDNAKLFVNNDNLDTEEGTLIEAVNSSQLDEQLPQLATDESGAMLRLIQVKLPDGNDGWVALND